MHSAQLLDKKLDRKVQADSETKEDVCVHIDKVGHPHEKDYADKEKDENLAAEAE